MAQEPNYVVITSDKDKWISFALCCLGLVGVAGIHRFYVGKIGTGVLWLLTGGLFGIGTIVDLIVIAMGNFKDNANAPLRR